LQGPAKGRRKRTEGERERKEERQVAPFPEQPAVPRGTILVNQSAHIWCYRDRDS
uniref:Uncharacterized protein n=1 Tax=Oryza brachyantha TaxID=4533 RepID=J3MX75_ORYBR